jgi:hypothetical protein
MLKKLVLMVWAVLLPSYCYSESIAPYYGYTGNAAYTGLSWSMDSVLPNPSGLDITGVIYSYKIQKQTNDSVDVHVQNQNALGTGYIFRETDQWLPGSLSGTQINKAVPVLPGIARDSWGQGSIQVDGPGSVTDTTVLYMYKVTPCYDPQYNPNCPGYIRPSPIIVEVSLSDIYDATKDENIDLDRSTSVEQNDENLEENKKDKEEEAEEKKRKYRLEKAMTAKDASALFAESSIIQQMNALSDIAITAKGYYAASIPGGVYPEITTLVDSKLPENKNGLRNGLAQQILHQQMIDSQYAINGN